MKYKILKWDYVFHADSIITMVETDDRTYIVQLQRREVADLDNVKQLIHKDIVSQQQQVPDWTGVSWTIETNE